MMSAKLKILLIKRMPLSRWGGAPTGGPGKPVAPKAENYLKIAT